MWCPTTSWGRITSNCTFAHGIQSWECIAVSHDDYATVYAMDLQHGAMDDEIKKSNSFFQRHQWIPATPIDQNWCRGTLDWSRKANNATGGVVTHSKSYASKRYTPELEQVALATALRYNTLRVQTGQQGIRDTKSPKPDTNSV